MKAVREVNSTAQLVQTEDMGWTRSTSELRYQADFENERRWLSLDLLAGTVSERHPLYRYLLRSGASEQELAGFCNAPCPVDVIGINYYVTSERFLDGRIELYPRHLLGGNGRHPYADVEAVRVCADGLRGPAALLQAAHARYQRPVVVTEAHIASSPQQQAAWLAYMWSSALQAREHGADVRAVTIWALLGAFGWDQLITKGAGTYEAGAFDVEHGRAVETTLATFIRSLSTGEPIDCESGWWLRPERLIYAPVEPQSYAA